MDAAAAGGDTSLWPCGTVGANPIHRIRRVVGAARRMACWRTRGGAVKETVPLRSDRPFELRFRTTLGSWLLAAQGSCY